MKRIFQVLVGLVAVFFLVMFGLTLAAQKSHYNQEFLAGKVPNPAPDGFLRGDTDFYRASWQGKKFAPATNTGINIFKKDGQDTENFPFKTSVGKGLRDPSLEVFKIDYANTDSPWYARPILDEIVEVAPGKYLGKIHYRLIPGFPFTIWYFTLEK